MKKLTLLLSILALFLFALMPVYAADITVDENCSLADAIKGANTDEAVGNCPAGDGVDVINLAEEVILGAELPHIASTIIVKGNNHRISGEGAHRIFYVLESGMLRIESLSISNGHASEFTLPDGNTVQVGGGIYNEGILIVTDSNFRGNSTNQGGGAIYNNSGVLAVSHSTFSDNSSAGAAAAIYSDGSSDGSLLVVDCLFNGNSATKSGGAIYAYFGRTVSISHSTFSNNSASTGGAIYGYYGNLTIRSSTFTQNSAKNGGAIFNNGESRIGGSTFTQNLGLLAEGAIYNIDELAVEQSTFSKNLAFEGGVVYNKGKLLLRRSAFGGNSADTSGGAIFNHMDLSVINSSYTENQAYLGGAIHLSGDSENLPKVEMAHATLVYNSAERGGGIHVEPNSYKAVNLYNSIFAGNTGGDCIGGLNNGAGNLIQDGSCDAKISSDPLLGDFVQPDDGSPPYHPLLPGSPAIDSAVSEYCPDSDQIGTPRPLNAACDIGAIEFVHEE